MPDLAHRQQVAVIQCGKFPDLGISIIPLGSISSRFGSTVVWGEERGLTKRLEIEPIVPPEFCFLGLVDLFKDSLSTFKIDT